LNTGFTVFGITRETGAACTLGSSKSGLSLCIVAIILSSLLSHQKGIVMRVTPKLEDILALELSNTSRDFDEE
jgi:hypothetical protein